MITGADLIKLALTREGALYVYGADVPLDDPHWGELINGEPNPDQPFDCAEFISWVVYQVTRKIYGCEPNNHAPIDTLDPWTGAWDRDYHSGVVHPCSIFTAGKTAGAILLRYDNFHHIVFSQGNGRTIEAKDSDHGVCQSHVDGRGWTHGILLPGVTYA